MIAGGAGLQLGMKLLAPVGAAAWTRWSRAAASVPACAWAWRSCCWWLAFIEAFWSSIAEVPAWGKFSVAGVLWAGVLLWLWRGGRGGGHAH